jgi:subtilisin family serine protease
MNFRHSAAASLLAATLSVSCSKENAPTSSSQKQQSVVAPDIEFGKPLNGKVEIGNNQTVEVSNIHGKNHIPIQGIVTEINSDNTAFKNSLGELVAKSELVNVSQNPQTGYFSGYIPLEKYQELKKIYGTSLQFLVNPVVYNSQDHVSVKQLSSQISAEVETLGVIGNQAYSGLKRIGEPEFRKMLESEIPNTKINGSLVNVGVTDTGVTYNHPAFVGQNGKQRISYMKDFTPEGQVYFSPQSKFEATPKEGDENTLLIRAKISPIKIGRATPLSDELETKKFELQVSETLKAKILSEEFDVRFGILSEKSYSNEEANEVADIDGNGKVNDEFIVVFISEKTGTKKEVYLNFDSPTDLRKTKPLQDFNQTGNLTTAFSEKVGIEFKTLKLKNKKEKDVEVEAISIVGYDAGNHGSHVSGIIAASKIIANDPDDTLARGVAPAANLMVNRVCANNGGCQAQEAMIDLAQNGAEIVNMSLGGLGNFNDGYDVQSLLVNRLTQMYNTIFVISAGNSGPGRNTVGSPSAASLSLSVGASASRALISKQYGWQGAGKTTEESNPTSDFMLFFSSRGPTAAGGFKPNIAAPGTELSSIQLNPSPGTRPGLDVYWGTSMAAPTASGAVALLLDAAKKYNLQNKNKPLLTDALTMRQVLIDSAKPFDVASYNPKTNRVTKGQYTWIDQGTGLLNLPRAWELLKKQSALKLPAPFAIAKNPSKKGEGEMAVYPEYGVRVVSVNPNQIPYDGNLPNGIDPILNKPVPKFSTGLWVDFYSDSSLYEVQLTRRLPGALQMRKDAGELFKKLNTTADTFVLETQFYGSNVEWLKAGVPNALDCTNQPTTNTITVIGPGAVDNTPEGAPASSVPLRASNLNVCVNRELVKSLPAGDHGAIIKAYKIQNGKKEPSASFDIPVSIAIPHKALNASEKYEIEGSVKSFAVQRNYVYIPKGTSLVKVSLEVPELATNGTGCAGVELMALEGANTLLPPEISPRPKAIASNCSNSGGALAPEKRTISFTRVKPTPGIWDLHVFGRYNFPQSNYKLTVEYANVKSTLVDISGGTEKLSGAFDFSVLDTSFKVEPSVEQSSYIISGIKQTTKQKAKQKETLVPLPKSGVAARTYDATVQSVIFETNGATGSDIDLEILECDDDKFTKCVAVASSGTSTDIERAEIKPTVGKFYKPQVVGFELPGGAVEFNFIETLNLVGDKFNGSVAIEAKDEKNFVVSYSLDTAVNPIFQDPRFTLSEYDAVGNIQIKNSQNALLVLVPVVISAKPVGEAKEVAK